MLVSQIWSEEWQFKSGQDEVDEGAGVENPAPVVKLVKPSLSKSKNF